MFRLFLAFAVPVAGLALAAASLAGKGLLAEPGGEPMLVADLSNPAALVPAEFGPEDCAARLLLAEEATGRDSDLNAADSRILALALHPVAAGLAVAIQEIPAGAPATGASLYLAVAADGRILAISETADFGLSKAGAAAAADCLPAAKPVFPGAV